MKSNKNNGTGFHKKEQGKETRKRIIEWFVKNPLSTKTECSKELGLSFQTVSKHFQNIIIKKKKVAGKEYTLFMDSENLIIYTEDESLYEKLQQIGEEISENEVCSLLKKEGE